MKKGPSIIIKPYSKRKKRKRIKRVFLFSLIIFVFLVLFLYLYLSWIIKKEDQEIEKLKRENERLRSEIRKIQTSEGVYEEFIRTRLGYIREGEKIVQYK